MKTQLMHSILLVKILDSVMVISVVLILILLIKLGHNFTPC